MPIVTILKLFHLIFVNFVDKFIHVSFHYQGLALH